MIHHMSERPLILVHLEGAVAEQTKRQLIINILHLVDGKCSSQWSALLEGERVKRKNDRKCFFTVHYVILHP